MNNINFVKNIDSLGRIVIPMDIRRKYNLNSGDFLSITCSDKCIYLNKYNCLTDNNKIKSIIDVFVEYYNFKFILMNNDSVIYSNVINNNILLDGNMINKIKMGNNMKYYKDSIIFDSYKIDDYYNMLPIVTNDGIVGSLIILGNSDTGFYNICSIIVKIISLELNIS